MMALWEAQEAEAGGHSQGLTARGGRAGAQTRRAGHNPAGDF